MATLDCRIVTPDGPIFAGSAEMIVVPGAEGVLGVLPRHAPLVAQLKYGEVRVLTSGDDWTAYAVSDGYFKVAKDVASVLVDDAVPSTAIDSAAEQAAADDAKARLAAADAGDAAVDRPRAERDLAIAENRLRVAGR